jgi:N-acetylneuraminic acid mutarotase
MMSVPSSSPNIKPLMYKAHEKSDKDDNWPKNIIGACMIYVEASKKYVLIGGNFNALENIKKNFQINREIIAGIDKNIENFYELEQKKIEYLTESVLNNSQSQKFIDIFVYETQPVRKWYKVSTLGRTPKARSFHKCIVMGNYVFLFGGVELGSKGENNSQNDLYVFNLLTYEWKLVICKKYPYDRCDFGWTHLEKIGILYGGAGSPNEIYFDDMWLFKYDDFDFSKESKKEIQKDYWSEITQYGSIPGKIKAFSMEYSVIDSSLYLFGGLDSRGKNRNDLYRYEISCSTWNIVSTKGKGPSERCYHEMALINKDYFVLYGGINGTLSKIDYIHNDLFLYNINELVWVQPIVGGLTPSPKFGFSFCSNYDFNQMEIIILGGYSKDYESSTSSNNKFMKVFSLCENG